MAVKGDIKDLSIANLLQAICHEDQNAALLLESPAEKVVIYFKSGKIVHAISSAYFVGEAVISRILSWKSGSFHLRKNVPIPRESIDTPCMQLILGSAKHNDENGGPPLEQESAFTPSTISIEDEANDNTLENDLVLLISSLENLQSQLLAPRKQPKADQALHLLADMVNAIASCLEKYNRRPSEDQVETEMETLLTITTYTYPAARFFHTDGNRLSVAACIALYNALKKDTVIRHDIFREIRESFIELLQLHYNQLIYCLHSPEIIKQWTEAGDSFFEELQLGLTNVTL